MDRSGPSVLSALSAEAATITLKGFRVTDTVVIDEVTLQGGPISVSLDPTGLPPTVKAGETSFRAMMTEANVNKLLASGTPSSAPVRNLKVTLFTGHAQFKGQYIKSVMSLPFTLDATPTILNGIRVSLDCRSSHVGGIELPSAVVEVIERALNEKLTIDLSNSAVPIRLDEVRCEPGRLTITGKARLNWPLTAGDLPATDPAGIRTSA